jgi:hypothetical protein
VSVPTGDAGISPPLLEPKQNAQATLQPPELLDPGAAEYPAEALVE